MLRSSSDGSLWIRSRHPLQPYSSGGHSWQAHWRRILNSSAIGTTFVCTIDDDNTKNGKDRKALLEVINILGQSYIEEAQSLEDDCTINDTLDVGTRVLVDWPAYKCAFGGASPHKIS